MSNVTLHPVVGRDSVEPWWKGSFEERMQHRAARRARPEFKARLEAITRRRRHREIWAAVFDDDPDPYSQFAIRHSQFPP